jgi:hypothetical protein
MMDRIVCFTLGMAVSMLVRQIKEFTNRQCKRIVDTVNYSQTDDERNYLTVKLCYSDVMQMTALFAKRWKNRMIIVCNRHKKILNKCLIRQQTMKNL